MAEEQVAHPPIVSREEWLAKRVPLLAQEMELTRQQNRLNAERRYRSSPNDSAPCGTGLRLTSGSEATASSGFRIN